MATIHDLDPARPYAARVNDQVPRGVCKASALENAFALLLLDLLFEVWDPEGYLLVHQKYNAVAAALVAIDDSVDRILWDDSDKSDKSDEFETLTRAPFEMKLELDPRLIEQAEWSRSNRGIPQALVGRTIRIRLMTDQEMDSHELPDMMTVHSDATPIRLSSAN